MNRRTTLKTFLTLTAGVTLLPFCMEDKRKAPILLKNYQLQGNQEASLEVLAETIIPTTDTPGARALSSHLFALMMVDECYKKEDREKFLKGLKEFDELCTNRYKNTFDAMQQAERTALVAAIENKEDIKDEVTSFYRTYKRHVVQHYTSSEFFLTRVQVYELAPARWHGCVPVTASA